MISNYHKLTRQAVSLLVIALLVCCQDNSGPGFVEPYNANFDPYAVRIDKHRSLDKIFVINLDQSADRLANMERQLASRELKFERISAVYGKAIPADELSYIYKPNRDFFVGEMSRGEIGNYLSHYNTMKTIIQNGHGTSMVLEDDVVLHPDRFNERVSSLLSHAPDNWDVIYLGCHANEKPHSKDKTRFGASVAPPETCHYSRLEMVSDGRLARIDTHCVAGNYGYLVSLQGASKLLMHMAPIQMPTDYTWKDLFVGGRFGPFQAYCANPELVVPNYSIENTINEGGVWRGDLAKNSR